jgi:uncharacterized protein DUF4326
VHGDRDVVDDPLAPAISRAAVLGLALHVRPVPDADRSRDRVVIGTPRVVHCRRVPRESFVYIGRENRRSGFAASPFANPFVIDRDGTRETVIARYRVWLLAQPALVARARRELRGHDLGCWCKQEDVEVACHGDVLLEIANVQP